MTIVNWPTVGWAVLVTITQCAPQSKYPSHMMHYAVKELIVSLIYFLIMGDVSYIPYSWIAVTTDCN